MISAECEIARFRLPGRAAFVGRLDAVIACVPDHVHQRVCNLVNNGPIQLGVLTFDMKLDALAGLGGDVADQPGHFLERPLERDHAQGHGDLLEIADDLAHMGEIALAALLADALDDGILNHHLLCNHQLADHVDEAIHPCHVDLDGRVGAALSPPRRLPLTGLAGRAARAGRRGGWFARRWFGRACVGLTG